MFKRNKIQVVAAIVAASVGGYANAGLLTLPPTGYFTYGNVNSYSLPILATGYDLANRGGTGPGNPYYINSSPGAIKDLVVIYTGAGGSDVTTNAAGFEDAYQTPSGAPAAFANTAGPISMIDPGSKAGIANPTSNTWDANLSAVRAFLNGGAPIFLFNNNETNKDQDLAIWAKVWITDSSNALYNNRYLYLSNTNLQYGLGGVPNGNAATYNPGNVAPAVDPSTGNTDYVQSGGTLCLNASLAIQACDGTEAYKINHNLGANQAAYAADMPVLDGWLNTLFALPSGLGDYTLHLQLALGCDPAWGSANNICDGKNIDNGYEQLFLGSTNTNFVNVPEPATLGLLGLGLAGLGFSRRRKS